MKLSLVIPCYNEARNIPLVLKRFAAVLTRKDVELILVNNGSKDDSAQVLAEQTPQFPFAKVVTVDVNQGYGFGILSGLQEAQGEFLSWTHADLQTDPRDALRALEVIESSSRPERTFVKGLRKNRPLRDTVFTVGMSIFETLYLRTVLWDINAQPNIFPRSLFAEWQNPPKDFSLDLYALYMAKKQGLDIVRLPVVFPERIHGQSSWDTDLRAKWKFIDRTLRYSIRLKRELL
ncbi:glycosyltransferase family 2 protein [Oceanidesulfovibrio marinus]|uniref:Glycosyltransferase family 2 protein n=1 Tax=Oceanidesulfovibrio marinus TaxID=370038 RepID=A0A6P1ZG48_9BACT|nr:glycosyltransferase family 2 protein [Oceanidesulfovibrio marinus]TVM32349.1 glycosyltransferase family 2 protein [Oceanidesulfovibrio marinus]